MDYQYIKVSFIDSMWVNEKVPSTKLLENGLKYVKNLNLGNKINLHWMNFILDWLITCFILWPQHAIYPEHYHVTEFGWIFIEYTRIVIRIVMEYDFLILIKMIECNFRLRICFGLEIISDHHFDCIINCKSTKWFHFLPFPVSKLYRAKITIITVKIPSHYGLVFDDRTVRLFVLLGNRAFERISKIIRFWFEIGTKRSISRL